MDALGKITRKDRVDLEIGSKLWLSYKSHCDAMACSMRVLRAAESVFPSFTRLLKYGPQNRSGHRNQVCIELQWLKFLLQYQNMILAKYAVTNRRLLGSLRCFNKPGIPAYPSLRQFAIIERIVAKPVESFEIPQKTATFYKFTELPVELQMMVWDRAATPPTCGRHGFELTTAEEFPQPLGRHGYRGDRGIWGACQLSRKCAKIQYAQAQTRAQQTSRCLCSTRQLAMTYASHIGSRQILDISQCHIDFLADVLKDCLREYSYLPLDELAAAAKSFFDGVPDSLEQLTAPQLIDNLVIRRDLRLGHVWKCPGL